MPTRILVVDDKPAEIEPVLSWLRQEGYEVALTDRAEQGLALSEQARPDLMLLDTLMPGMNGIELCQRMRRNIATAQVPVILMTDRSGSEARAECIRAGANDSLTRPVTVASLHERLSDMLGAENGAATNNYHLLEETCHAALTILPCNLAWLLTVDDGV